MFFVCFSYLGPVCLLYVSAIFSPVCFVLVESRLVCEIAFMCLERDVKLLTQSLRSGLIGVVTF